MTNALILGMLGMLLCATDVDYPKLFIFIWLLAVFFNSFASEEWR